MDGRGGIIILISRNFNCWATCVKGHWKDEPPYSMILHLPHHDAAQNGPKLHCGASIREYKIYRYTSTKSAPIQQPAQYMKIREWVAYTNGLLDGPAIVAKHTREWKQGNGSSNRW